MSGTPSPACQSLRELAADLLHIRTNPEVGKLRHLHSGHAAGIDAGKRREIHVHVQRQAVVTGTAPDPQPQARQLAALYINTRRITPAHGSDSMGGNQVDHRLLQLQHQTTHGNPQATHVEQWIGHQLTGPVIRDLAAAVGCDPGMSPGISR